MANFDNNPTWADDVYQLATTDRAKGGVGGDLNVPLEQLADRTSFLKAKLDNLAVVNVMDYGAVGDGVVDDTAAIQDAIDAADAGAIIYFGSFRCVITAQIAITKRLHLVGQGAAAIVEKTAVTATGSGGALIKFTGSDCSQSSVSGLGCEGLETLATFNANAGADNKELCFLRFESCDAVVVENVRVTGKRIGVVVDTCTNTRVSGLVFYGILSAPASGGASGTDNYSTAVRVKGGAKTTVDGLVAKNTGSGVLTGVNGSSVDPSRVSVVNAHIENAWDNGIYFSSAQDSTITGCTVLTSNGSGIKVRGSRNIVSLNQITSCLVGIGVSGAGTTPDAYDATGHGCLIQGNRIEDIDRDGINIDTVSGYQCRHIQVVDNYFRNIATEATTYAAIRGDGDYHIIRGNIFEDINAQFAVLLAGAADDLVEGLTIADNQFFDVDGDAIRLQYVTKSLISGNTFKGVDGDGIDLRNCVDNDVVNNKVIAGLGGNGVSATAANGNTGNKLVNTDGPFDVDLANNRLVTRLDGVFNVKDYGAVGDGTTDDTDAIQDAFDAVIAAGGGTVLFPPGTYKTSGGVQAGDTAVAISGGSNIMITGYGATVHAGSGTARVLGVFGSSNVHIRGLKIVGYTGVLDPATENHALIAISNSSNVTVEDCYLTNSLGDCIYIGGDITNGASLGYTSKNIWVTRNVLKSRYGNGVASSSSGSMSRMAVAATDCDGLSITDNTIYGKIDFEPNANYQGVRFGLVQGNRCLAGPVRPQAVIGSDYWHDEPVTDPSGLASPTAAPTLGTATTGGTIPAGTYYACITYYLGSNETARSPESASITTTGSASTITVTGGAIPAGATGVKVYLTPATASPGTETYAALYTSGTSVVVTALPSTAAAWPPSELINHIDVTGPAGTSDSDFNVFQNNVVENGILSCSNVYRANIVGNLFKKGHLSIGDALGAGTSNVMVRDNVVRALYAGKTSAIRAENFSSCVFSGNVLESGTGAYLFEIVDSNGGSTFNGNGLTDAAATGLFTGSLNTTDVAIANSRSPASNAALPNSTAQKGEAWIHNVAEVTLTTTNETVDWNTVKADFWNLSGNGQSLGRVQNIPDGTLLTIRSGAYGGSAVSVLYSSSYIRTTDGSSWVSSAGGESITFHAYSGILWEVARSRRVRETHFNVKDYGAKGDGTTDDTAAIAAAITAVIAAGGGEVFFPAGTYLTAATVTLGASNIALRGVGGQSIIKAKDSTNFEHVVYATGRSNLHISNLVVDVNQAGRAASLTTRSNGIVLAACTDCTVENVTAKNAIGSGGETNVPGMGLSIAAGSVRGKVVDCTLLDCGISTKEADGVFLSGTQMLIADCTAKSCLDTAFVIETSQQSGISNCTALSCGVAAAVTNASADDAHDNFIHGLTAYDWSATLTGGIQIGNPDSSTTGDLINTQVSGVVLRNATGTGPGINVRKTGAAKTIGLVLSNNIVDGAGTQGILLDAEGATINACEITSTGSCIQVEAGSENVVITNNRLYAGGTFGVALGTGCDVVSVQGNHIESLGSMSWGIYAFGTSTNIRTDKNTIIGEGLGEIGADVTTTPYHIDQIIYAAAAPAAGLWPTGFKVFNNAPAAEGYMGWICVSGGTPGTWKGFGLIEA